MHNFDNANRTVVYDGKIAGLYDLEETLGSGHFAVVKLARHVFTGEKVAVKVIDKTKLDEVSRAHLFQEVRCMKLVQHPNVVRLYEVIDTQTKLYLILELGDGGDLYDYIMKHEGGLSENVAREYFRQIVRAISYCHQLHVVHRDLKPENVVFFEKLGVVKLTDFGFSNKFCPGQKLETSCGSLAYSAPEILLGDSYDAPAVDIWSLGVILYMLVCGQPPFEKANDSETLTMIMDCKYTIPAHVSSNCQNLISQMLVRDPDKRATLEQIGQDPWLLQGTEKGTVPEYLPLVSRQQVSDEDHSLIIQKMINGEIGTKEEILDALDRNEYNHITATYFLLAERKLRQHRQDQLQIHRPELSLTVNDTSSRILPKSQKKKSVADISGHLLVPLNSEMNIIRTPASETKTGGRSRKCSIVQEEDDEDEISGSQDELSTPQRRGSRSEGRINLAIQDRVSENQCIVKPSPSSQSKGLDNICGIKVISKDSNNVKSRLGLAGNPRVHFERYYKDKSASKLNESVQKTSMQHINCNLLNQREKIETKILVDSSTITIPITSRSKCSTKTVVPKYKTMPIPTMPSVISAVSALNEIYEEGTDIGSSDSATTTPRPISRNFTRNNTPTVTQRRSKFHKTRTPSCSSSDASDDDSESRKKRVHKINDISKPLQHHRRDSHDDSSDSQDQGNASASGSNTSYSSYILCTTTVNTNPNQNTSTQTNGGSTNNTSKKTEGQTDEQMKFRRHRAGRRRAGETRLRESQSLNRITEGQESDIPAINQINSSASNLQINHDITSVVRKPKGFSARLFQGFVRKNEILQTLVPDNKGKKVASCDGSSILIGVELAKSLAVSETKSSSTTKKLKMLGRYFQVHKKICIPLPGLFQRGRLYKAQSCGSIIRDKINTNIHNNHAHKRHSVLFTERGKIISPYLGTKLLGNSNGNINENCSIQTTPECNIYRKASTSTLHSIGEVSLSSKC